MKRGVISAGLIGVVVAVAVAAAIAEDREIPEPFAPFEHMIGSWKGTGVPMANRLKGWAETHAWAWKFAKGNPVGMSLELTGDNLAKALLTYDQASKQYRLEGTDPAGKPVVYVGSVDKTGRLYVFDREGGTDEGKDRLILRPNSNLIRYTLDFEHKEPGAPQYKKVVEVGLTKEGESFAAGGSASNLPKCIITGGAATTTVSYQGKTYPICCSGCRDEFNDNPEKYVKKASLMAEKGSGQAPVKAASSSVGKDDGAFDGLVSETPKTKTMTKSARTAPRPKAVEPAAAVEEPAAPKADATAVGKDATRAASLLRLGQNLKKSGKAAAALKYYQQIVKDYAKTPSAKTASARIKALESE